MNEATKLERLLELAASLGINVREVSAGSAGVEGGGALVTLRGEEVLFLDRRAGASEQLAVVASALRGRAELQDMYIPPVLRELLN